jgi:hypothetical protein
MTAFNATGMANATMVNATAEEVAMPLMASEEEIAPEDLESVDGKPDKPVSEDMKDSDGEPSED